MSSSSNLTCVAAIAGAHGVHGNIKVKSFTEDPMAFADYGPLFSETGEKLFTPKSVRPVGKFFTVSVEERLSREAIEGMKSTKLFVPRDALPETDEDEYYYSDLIGMTVVDQDGESVGVIHAVHEFGAGDTLEIKPASGPSFFHPFTLQHAPKVDLTSRQVTILLEEAIEARGDGAPKSPS